MPCPPVVDDGEAEWPDPRLSPQVRHQRIVVTAVDERPVATVGRDVPVKLDAAPEVDGVGQIAVVAPDPLFHAALLDPKSISSRLRVCPEVWQVVSICLSQLVSVWYQFAPVYGTISC